MRNSGPVFSAIINGLIALLSVVGSGIAHAQGGGTPNPFADRLTGDWVGERSKLAARGLSFDLDYTAFYQGLFSGTGDKGGDFGNRADAYANFDTEKLGWWKGGLWRVHAEYFGGPLPPNLGGTLLPTNLGVRLPSDGKNRVTISNIVLTQRMSAPATLIVGKINTVDLLAGDTFFGGTGDRRFSNLSFAAPPNGLQPPVIMGAIVSLRSKPLDWTFMVFDPEDRTQDYFPKKLFGSGVNVSVSGKYPFALSGRTSSVSVTGIYSTKDGVNLNDVLLPPGLETRKKKGSWHASVQFAHFLRESPDRPGDGWGVFAKAGFSDGNPNPYQSFLTGGIGGRGLIPSRPQDSFGLGYFYYDFSDDLQRAVAPAVKFKNEHGAEAFYSYAITPYLQLTGDLQYIDPATGANDNAFIGGLRLRVRF